MHARVLACQYSLFGRAGTDLESHLRREHSGENHVESELCCRHPLALVEVLSAHQKNIKQSHNVHNSLKVPVCCHLIAHSCNGTCWQRMALLPSPKPILEKATLTLNRVEQIDERDKSE
jgi:hypothetical protein